MTFAISAITRSLGAASGRMTRTAPSLSSLPCRAGFSTSTTTSAISSGTRVHTAAFLAGAAAACRARATTLPKTLLVPLSRFHSSTTVNDNSDTTATSAAAKKPETRPCWKCSTPVPFLALLCSNPECRVVQTVAPGANYYEVLGLSPEPTFDIDIKQLRNKFLRIQQQIHPDSYSNNTNGDQVYAQQQSSLANKAYATLKEPLSRANYMLDLLGAPIHETESLDEPELLMEVMEARELLEDAQTEDEIQDLKSQNDARIKEAVDGLSKAFQSQDLDKAKTLAIELQYWIRIQNVIRDWVAGHPIVADHV